MTKLALTLVWFISIYTTCAQIHILDTASNIHQVTEVADLEKWKTVKDEDGIRLQYRWLKIDNSIKTRELSLHFVTHTEMDTVLTYLQDAERHTQWNMGVKTFDILSQDSTQMHWVSHTEYNIPFPISQQDLVVNNSLTKTDSSMVIDITSQPNFIPPLEDVDRVKYYIAQWEMNKLDSTHTEITFSAITLSKSYIPRFIKDPIIQNNLVKSFKALKEALETKQNHSFLLKE